MSDRLRPLSDAGADGAPSQNPVSDRLESWKEIAAHLKRDLRTVQRWEKREGLPIHRHHHDERASVFAYKSELDTWWHNDYLRLAADASPAPDQPAVAPSTTVPQPLAAAAPEPKSLLRSRWRLFAVAIVLAAAVAAIILYPHIRTGQRLTERDTIVLADFSNFTGDPVFDGTLREGLAVQLEQSPFLSLISDERIRQTLKLMEKPADTKLSSDVARDLCERVGSKAYISGSIAKLGSDYVIGLKPVDCATGDSLSDEQVQASGKEKVLDALGQAAAELRKQLGESLNTIRVLDTPLYQATTPSLEALRAYTLAAKAPAAEAVSLYQRAIELDPNFAMAYDDIGLVLDNMGESDRGHEAVRRAFDLSSRVSTIEQSYISEDYYSAVTGQVRKAIEVAQLRARMYPRAASYGSIGADYMWLGQYEDARVNNAREPCEDCANVELTDLALNRFDDAKSVLDQERARSAHRGFFTSYELAFLRNDRATMGRELSSAHTSGVDPEDSEDMDLTQADTELYYGHAKASRIFDVMAVHSAEQKSRKGSAALWLLEQALREAEIGFSHQAISKASLALTVSPASDVRVTAALALARGGAGQRAEQIVEILDREYPADSILQMYWSSTVKAAVALQRGNGSRAVEFLKASSPVELSGWTIFPNATTMYPVYLRGQAYLQLSEPRLAIVQFQNIINHRGLILNSPLGALARLQVGRAYSMEARMSQGEERQAAVRKARAAYQDFLTLWKDADPDIPILKQAKAEYAKLK